METARDSNEGYISKCVLGYISLIYQSDLVESSKTIILECTLISKNLYNQMKMHSFCAKEIQILKIDLEIGEQIT